MIPLRTKNYENKLEIIVSSILESGLSETNPVLHVHKDTPIQTAGKNECGYFTVHFAKCKVHSLPYHEVNVESIKNEIVENICYTESMERFLESLNEQEKDLVNLIFK